MLWQMLKPFVADVITTVSIYFNFSSEMLEQNLIPNMWQMVLANVSIKGWIIGSNIQSFFYGP